MTAWWYWLGFAIAVVVVFVISCVLLQEREDESFREFIRERPWRAMGGGRW